MLACPANYINNQLLTLTLLGYMLLVLSFSSIDLGNSCKTPYMRVHSPNTPVRPHPKTSLWYAKIDKLLFENTNCKL